MHIIPQLADDGVAVDGDRDRRLAWCFDKDPDAVLLCVLSFLKGRLQQLVLGLEALQLARDPSLRDDSQLAALLRVQLQAAVRLRDERADVSQLFLQLSLLDLRLVQVLEASEADITLAETGGIILGTVLLSCRWIIGGSIKKVAGV